MRVHNHVDHAKKRQSINPANRGANVRAKILRLLGVNERLSQFHGHPLLRLRPPPCTDVSAIARHAGDGLLLDVASNADDAHAVQVLEVVAEIEFVEVEWDAELGIAGGEEGGSDEGDDKFRAVFSGIVSIGFWLKG